MRQEQDRKTIKLVAIGIAVLALIGIALFIVDSQLNKNPYGDNVAIKNYDQKVKNLPNDYKNLFSAMLFEAVKVNLPDVKPGDINGGTIREGSDTQQEVTTGRQYAGSFIVDIESVKQSYRVQYEYSSNPGDGFSSGYPLLVSCLEKDELIYGDFNCKDKQTENSQETDPIIGILPYVTLDYELRAIYDDSGDITLRAQLFLSAADYRSGIEKIVAQRKKSVEQWIRSAGYNPANYVINYIY